MKILISSVDPRIASGYGSITKRLIQMFNTMSNVEVKVIAYYGAKFKTEYEGVEILPNWGSGFIGEESILAQCKLWEPDLFLTTYDIFILEPQLFKQVKATGTKVASMLMVDSSPFQICNTPSLAEVDYPIIVTRWAKQQIPTDYAQIVTYIPLSLDKEYYITHKTTARKQFNELLGDIINEDTKLTTVVSANCGHDDRGRKNWYGIIAGWQKHLESTGCVNKRLYLHTDVRGLAQGGTDLKTMMLTLKYTPHQASTVIFPNQLKYLQNEFSPADMRTIYNSSDVYLNPSYSEGFGMPIAESIACGCYPIVTDFGASREIICNTQKNPSKHLINGSPLYVGNNAIRCYTSPQAIADKLTEAYKDLSHDSLEAATKCQLEYGEINNTKLWNELITKIGDE